MRDTPVLRAIETSVHGAGLPYGYAITVWSTGAVLIDEHGPASPPLVFLFAGGAAAAYGVLKVLTWNTQQEADTPLTKSPRPVRAGLIHVCAIGLAIAAAMVVADVSGDVPWFAAPFVATFLYLSGSSIEVALVEEEGDSDSYTRDG